MEDNNLLLRIYIGQKINYSRGVVEEFKGKSLFTEEEKMIIDHLKGKKLIKKNQPYSIRAIQTLVTTKRGAIRSRELIENILQEDSTLIDELREIPRKALGFFLINLNQNIYEKSRRNWFLDWKDFMLYKTEFFNYSIHFCETLQKHQLAVLVHDYASTRGGRIDPEKYVIPDEVKEYLTKNLSLDPFTYEEILQANLFLTLYKIRHDILPIRNDGKRRNKFWNLLRTLPFDESAIEALVNEFQKMKITTPYSSIENEQFLFTILDEARFDVALNMRTRDFMSQIIEGTKKEFQVSVKRASSPFKTHSDLFGLIGNFEIKLREYLINEMSTIFKADEGMWYDQLKEIKTLGGKSPFNSIFDKLESRREEDRKNKILPEDELIYYADITDYKDIILRNWQHLENKFKRIGLNKEKFEHGMNELNKIRRKVMHLRDIRPYEEKTLRLYIIPELERIFV